mgnify:FL=1
MLVVVRLLLVVVVAVLISRWVFVAPTLLVRHQEEQMQDVEHILNNHCQACELDRKAALLDMLLMHFWRVSGPARLEDASLFR